MQKAALLVFNASPMCFKWTKDNPKKAYVSRLF